MQEKIKEIWNSIRKTWGSLGKKVRTLLCAGVGLILVAAAVVLIVSLNRPYTVLFTRLSQTDLSEIAAYLSENGVTDYRVEGDDTILVPRDQEEQLKAALLVEGYPSSGSDYSMYLDNVSSLTTESERTQLILYDLQDRLSGVIRRFPGVREATVTISPGEDHTYVLDNSNVVEASAWVAVEMDVGQTLTEGQVSAIRSAVSHAVQGLSIEDVSVTDQYGNDYTADGTLNEIQDVSRLKLALEEQTNNKVRTQILQVLIPLFGEENVRVGVNSVVDVDRTYTDSTDYNREEGEDGTIIGDRIYEQTIIRGDGETVGGVVGTPSNADLNTYVEENMQVNGDETLIQNSGEEHSLVDTQQTQVEHLAGTVVDVMVSVTINQSAAETASVRDLLPHVARAAGIGTQLQEEKISILISPFYEPPILPPVTGQTIPLWVLIAAGAGLLLFLVLLVIVLLIRRKIRKKRARLMQEQEGVETAAAPPPAPQEGADIMDMKTEKSMELRKEVRRFAEENPEIAAQMVKSWLREGDDGG